MRDIVASSRFRKDLRRQASRGKNLAKLEKAVDLLREKGELPSAYRAHPLRGVWEGTMDCHIEPDWILIYSVEGDIVRLVRTGSHGDLFKGY